MDAAENKGKKMGRNVILLSTLGIFLFVAYLNILSPAAFGGSEVFLLIIGLGIFLSKKVRELQTDMNILIQAILLLVILNHYAAMEYTKGFSQNLMIESTVIIVLLSGVTAVAVRRPLKSNDSEQLRREMKGRVLAMIDGGIMVITIVYTAVTIVLYSVIFDKKPVNSFPIRFSALILLCFILALTVSFIRGRRVPDDFINFLVVRKIEGNAAKISRWGKSILVGTFGLGTLLEVIRGLWVLWLLSWIAFSMIVLTSWRTWKYYFVESTIDENILDPKILPSIYDIAAFLKFVGINFLVISIYFFGIILLWHFIWRR